MSGAEDRARAEGFRSGLRTAANYIPSFDGMIGSDTSDLISACILEQCPDQDPGEEKMTLLYAGRWNPRDEGSADGRLAAIGAGQSVGEVYASYVDPQAAFQAELNILLRRATFSESKVFHLEVENRDLARASRGS